jgi:hypothetical protein
MRERTVWQILRRQVRKKPYIFTMIRKLEPEDCSKRKKFCETLQAEKPLHSARGLATKQHTIPVAKLIARQTGLLTVCLRSEQQNCPILDLCSHFIFHFDNMSVMLALSHLSCRGNSLCSQFIRFRC